MNVRIVLLAALVAVIGAAALMMCDDSDAAAGDVLASGSCGTSLTYEIRSLNADDSQVELIINGSGTMSNFGGNVPWESSKTKILSATLSSGITSIGTYAFSGCTNLALTELPAGITSIGNSAFYNCTNLALTELPAGITSIGTYAFSGCTNLALTELPAGLTRIENAVFGNCTSMTLTELPAGITSIGNESFFRCTSMTLTELPAGLTRIGTDAFGQCMKIKTLTMPAINITGSSGLSYLNALEYTTSMDWGSSNRSYTPQYSSRNTIQSITFAEDYIPTNALYGQNLDTLTITNASGPDVLGIYTAPDTRATASALTVNGTAAQIVRLTEITGSAALTDGRITANDTDIHWNTTPPDYAGGESDASVDILVYPAGYHTKEPNDYGVWMTTISILLVVGLLMAFILPMIVRRLE